MNIESSAPSIGSVELSFDSLGNRVRQILPGVSRPRRIFESLVQANVFAAEHGATRRLVRAFLNENNREDVVSTVGSLGYEVEAQIPLAGRFTGLDLIYLGSNNTSRFSHPEVLTGEADLIAQIRQKPRKSLTEVFDQAQNERLRVVQLRGELSLSDRQRLIEMYKSSFSSYPFDIEQQIIEMVQQPGTHVYGARSMDDHQLYAVCATEEVSLPFGGGHSFRMREMGDSAKMNFRNGKPVNGVNAPLKMRLLERAFRAGSDLVFCETRAALGAVNAINYSIGMELRGVLPKSTHISGPQTVDESGLDGEINGKLGNMNVWALNRSEMRSLVAQMEA